jgi:hypothetical protein
MTRKTRQRLRFVLVLLVVSVMTACIFLPDFIGQMNAGKYDPVEDGVPKPTGIAETPTAEEQTEPHTCGLHAMRSMYLAYRLDVDQYDLRFRLGTDHPAMRVDSESTGTLHPDLYRVLAQDGFAIEALDLDAVVAPLALQNHLAWQQLALAVVYRNTYHWVLIGPSENPGDVVVYDSLKFEPSTMSIDALFDDALSITLVEPSDGEPISATDAHAAGLAEMARLYKRKK